MPTLPIPQAAVAQGVGQQAAVALPNGPDRAAKRPVWLGRTARFRPSNGCGGLTAQAL